MPPAPADFRRLLTKLLEHGVDFIVVGGVAAVVQGAPVTTFDLDIVPALTAENVAALHDALTDLDASYRGRPDLVPDIAALEAPGHKLLSTSAGPLDVLGSIGDAQGYEELLDATQTIEAWGMSIRILGLKTLIEIKRSLGREKDKAVLAILERTLEENSDPE